MNYVLNNLDQPIGLPVTGWTPPDPPPRHPLVGRYCHLESLDTQRHAADLYAAYSADTAGLNWTYLSTGPFDSLAAYCAWMDRVVPGDDPLFFAIIDRQTDKPGGVASYLRINPPSGSIEVGHINYAPDLQRTPAATEAMALMMQRAFEMGYRRYEWKCDALNAKSRAAAQRLGLSFEGIFRQATVYKERSRDTAWYAAIDQEWPALQAAYQQWLDPANFDENGRQRVRLSDLTAPIVKQR